MNLEKKVILKATILCRQCQAVIDVDPNPYRPFCSDRCRKVDLGKWFQEGYRVVGEPAAPLQDKDPNAED